MKQIYRAFQHAISGLYTVTNSERAFQQELFVASISIPVALLLNVSWINQILLISSIFLVLIAELLNTAIEKVVDRISREKHELSKQAKDIASAAVMFAVFHAAVVWSMTLLKLFFS